MCVITADVNRSSLIADRAGVQHRIFRALEIVNEHYKEDLLVPFAITVGDEWQGLLRSPAMSYRIIDSFREQLDGVDVSYGVGIGSIATEFRERTAEMDGEAFRHSREALNRAKKQGREIIFKSDDASTDALLNAVCLLLATLRSKWTKRQKEKILLYKQLRNESRVAEKLGVTQGDIHQALKAGAGKVYLECEDELNFYLHSKANS